jgi:hypothetical protein
MKKDNRSGGKLKIELVRSATFFLFAALLSCSQEKSNKVVNGKYILSELTASNNFDDLSDSFTVAKDTLVRINAFGEGVDYSINKEVIRSYDNDCIEFFFDLKNNKIASFDATGDDRQYRIVWQFLRIDGINCNAENVRVGQSDPNEKSYIMEIAFPWKTLEYVVPVPNKKIGFDVAIDDNDKDTRKGMLSWNSTVDDAWKNTAIYGTLLLGTKNIKLPEHNAVSLVTKKAPEIDGAVDKEWEHVPKYDLTKIMTGYVENKWDLSGYYRSMWDKENLYLLVNVHDNIKNYAQAMFDYGWIENSHGQVIWRMEMNKTKPAGGAMKNRVIDTSILLKKGSYKLRYITDESHSPRSWDATPPKTSFYGIRLTYHNGN